MRKSLHTSHTYKLSAIWVSHKAPGKISRIPNAPTRLQIKYVHFSGVRPGDQYLKYPGWSWSVSTAKLGNLWGLQTKEPSCCWIRLGGQGAKPLTDSTWTLVELPQGSPLDGRRGGMERPRHPCFVLSRKYLWWRWGRLRSARSSRMRWWLSHRISNCRWVAG